MPAAAVAAEIASTPWIDEFEAPKVLRSDDVEVRLIVSPVPEPRLMMPEPVRIDAYGAFDEVFRA